MSDEILPAAKSPALIRLEERAADLEAKLQKPHIADDPKNRKRTGQHLAEVKAEIAALTSKK